MSNIIEMNKRAARKLAEKKDFDKEEILVCVACGRTVIRTQNLIQPGREDSIFCTCEEKGPPMASIVEEDA